MDYENSQTLDWLLNELQKSKANLNKNDLVYLLNLIHAPANLHLLFQALKNFPTVLRRARDIYRMDDDIFPDIDFTTATSTCNGLLEAEPAISECAALEGLFPKDEQSTRPQLHNYLTSYPLYCCLCFWPQSAEQSAQNAYSQLLAQVFLASQIITSNGANLSDLTDHYLSVRKLSEGTYEEQLLSLPSKTLSAQSYLSKISTAEASSHIHNAGIILSRAYLGKRRRKKSTLSGIPQKPKDQFKTEDLEDYECPEAISTGENYITRTLLTKRRAQQYADYGGSPAEFAGGKVEVPVAIPNEKTYSGPTLSELAYQGKQRSNQESMKNQFNPMGWNELNEFDLQVFFRFLQGEIETRSNEKISELRDYLQLMFWLSAPLERVLNLGKFNGRPGPRSAEGIYLQDDNSLLAHLHSPGPPLESSSINTTSRLAYPVSYYSNIPLPPLAHTENLLKNCRNNNSASSSPEVVHDEDMINDIKKQLRAELRHLNDSYGTRLSLGRLSHYWLHSLGTAGGEDMPSALLFFGQIENFSAARLHYTCAPAQRMETSYRRICSELLNDLDIETFSHLSLVNEEIFLGTPFCPRPEVIVELVKNLINAIEQSRPTRKHLSLIKNFHNHFSIYTACLIAFATTYRAVQDPSFYERDINFASGLGVISDKDDKTYYHSRFVWIAEVCRQQIINYRRHLQRLFELLALRSPALFKLFNNANRQGSPLNLIFLPRENTSVKILRPGLLESRLKNLHNYDLPVNAHRHYLKAELMKSGCSPDIIEAQLGHWEQGQEPWNRFSNLHPREFCRQLSLHLSPVLERDGWKAIEGITL